MIHAYSYFDGKIDAPVMLLDLVIEPSDYVGYHQHDGNQEVLYVLSGTAEHFQDGERCLLEPGDAVLVKSGQAHAIRNPGDEDLRYLVVFAAVSDAERGSVQNLPLPEALADWGKRA
jgi:quercetin dioxygenase-like cupin family protein